jgi:prepilin-type N-terminal cleavage/methylation domain-containing protein
MKRNTLQQKGFTLVEIMVATSIFMIIMLVAMGALIISSDTSKKAQALRLSMDNVNFAMESVTRSLRMGTHYLCDSSSSLFIPTLATATRDCAGGDDAVAFTFAEHDQNFIDTIYRHFQRIDGTHSLQRCDGAMLCVDMVSPEVDVQKLSFFVNGSSITDSIQPSIYIIMKGVVNNKGGQVPFALQTMVSQRSGEQ